MTLKNNLNLNELKLFSVHQEPTTPNGNLNTPRTVTVNATFFPPSPNPIGESELSNDEEDENSEHNQASQNNNTEENANNAQSRESKTENQEGLKDDLNQAVHSSLSKSKARKNSVDLMGNEFEVPEIRLEKIIDTTTHLTNSHNSPASDEQPSKYFNKKSRLNPPSTQLSSATTSHTNAELENNESEKRQADILDNLPSESSHVTEMDTNKLILNENLAINVKNESESVNEEYTYGKEVAISAGCKFKSRSKAAYSSLTESNVSSSTVKNEPIEHSKLVSMYNSDKKEMDNQALDTNESA